MAEHEPHTRKIETDETIEIPEIISENEVITANQETTVAIRGLAHVASEKRRERYLNTGGDASTDEMSSPDVEYIEHPLKPVKASRLGDIKGQRYINKKNKAERLIKSENHTLKMIWGDSIGTDEFEESIKTMRRSLRKHARKAHKEYKRNTERSESLLLSLKPKTEKITTKVEQVEPDNEMLGVLDRSEQLLDTNNILDLKRSTRRDIEKRIALEIAKAIDKGRPEESVPEDAIREKATLEGIARYFGLKSWDDIEEKVPGWLLDPVIELYGLSEQELEAEAERESRPIVRRRTSNRPVELAHDEAIDIHDDRISEDINPTSDKNSLEQEDEAVRTEIVGLFMEMAKPENRYTGLYDTEIGAVAEMIEKDIEEMTKGVNSPAEKHKIASEIYAEQIANMLGLSAEQLQDPEIVPKELRDQIVDDLTAARKMNTDSQKPRRTAETNASEAETLIEVKIDWDEVLNPQNVMNLRKKRDAQIKRIKEEFLKNNPDEKFTAEQREIAHMNVESALIVEHLGIDSFRDLDPNNQATRQKVEKLNRMLGMDWEELQGLAANKSEQVEEKESPKKSETPRKKRARENAEKIREARANPQRHIND